MNALVFHSIDVQRIRLSDNKREIRAKYFEAKNQQPVKEFKNMIEVYKYYFQNKGIKGIY